MKYFILMSLAALLSVIAMTSCNYMKEPVLCAPCSEWIMDTKINAVKLRWKERHECSRDTYMCYFAPHLSTSYIMRGEQDNRHFMSIILHNSMHGSIIIKLCASNRAQCGRCLSQSYREGCTGILKDW
jgi:hypothetical protein